MTVAEYTCQPGRPKFLDDIKRAEICALVTSGCSYRTAARYVGCTVQAISALAKRDPAFAEQLDKSVAQREVILLSHLRESSKRSWRATAFLLQKTVGGRFGGHVPTLDEEAEHELLDAVFTPSRDIIEPDPAPPPPATKVPVTAPHDEKVAIIAPRDGAPPTKPDRPSTNGEKNQPASNTPKPTNNASQTPTHANQKPAPLTAPPTAPTVTKANKKNNAANTTRKFMDALERLWERQDELEDEKFFDPNYDDT
jgi:outer membrane biosynthesis protein TonB